MEIIEYLFFLNDILQTPKDGDGMRSVESATDLMPLEKFVQSRGNNIAIWRNNLTSNIFSIN